MRENDICSNETLMFVRYGFLSIFKNVLIGLPRYSHLFLKPAEDRKILTFIINIRIPAYKQLIFPSGGSLFASIQSLRLVGNRFDCDKCFQYCVLKL